MTSITQKPIPDEKTIDAIFKLPYSYAFKDFIRMMIIPSNDARIGRSNINC